MTFILSLTSSKSSVASYYQRNTAHLPFQTNLSFSTTQTSYCSQPVHAFCLFPHAGAISHGSLMRYPKSSSTLKAHFCFLPEHFSPQWWQPDTHCSLQNTSAWEASTTRERMREFYEWENWGTDGQVTCKRLQSCSDLKAGPTLQFSLQIFCFYLSDHSLSDLTQGKSDHTSFSP